MGFRSTITMQDYGQKWPAWLLEKYKRHDFPTSGPLSFKFECKIYDDEIFLDMRKALLENNYNFSSMRVIALHECGGVTAIDISKEGITYCEPTGWVAVNFITHSYCSDCSLPNPERLPGGTTNSHTNQQLPSAAPVDRVVGRCLPFPEYLKGG